MKAQMKLLPCFLAVLALLSAPQLAPAYYDPGLQRWINRDPIRERGFETLRRHSSTRSGRIHTADGDLYQFVYNKPGNFIDSDGLGVVALPIGGVVVENPIGASLCVGAAFGAVLCWTFPEIMTKPGQ
jgi:hypothetical protein